MFMLRRLFNPRKLGFSFGVVRHATYKSDYYMIDERTEETPPPGAIVLSSIGDWGRLIDVEVVVPPQSVTQADLERVIREASADNCLGWPWPWIEPSDVAKSFPKFAEFFSQFQLKQAA